MRILVVGSGGREHALCWAFKKSARTSKIFCADGNAGISEIAELVNIKPDETENLADFAKDNRIDLTFVGGETALSLGIVDEFEHRGLRIVGAGRDAARLESSKSFAKDFMVRHAIPTAAYKTAGSAAEAVGILGAGEFGDKNAPDVVKADAVCHADTGRSKGWGTVLFETREQAQAAIQGFNGVELESRPMQIKLDRYD